MAIKIHGGEDTPLVQCINPILDKWMVLWAIGYEDNSFTFMAEEIGHKPTLQEIKDIVLSWCNADIDNRILSGFVWRDIPVWLSMENQFNYKVAYDIAAQSGGEILPTFKFGTTESPVYYKFESFEDLKDFYLKAMAYVTQTLDNGWAAKDTIDWGAYSAILNET